MKILQNLFFFLFSVSLFGIPKEEFNLWPNSAPGEKRGEVDPEAVIPPRTNSDVARLSNVSIPTIKVFPAVSNIANGTAILVCPGGGYNILAYEHEGVDVCQWLNSLGVTSILLKYRVPRRQGREKYDAPLQDAQRAISIIRKNALEWNIEPNKIGILGFSAGGNLAVMASTSFKLRAYEKLDSVDEYSCRPDFSILIYPAYLVDRKGLDHLFPEVRVSVDCPPFFFVHTGDDHVPVEGSVLLYLALEKAGVKGNELHVYPFGGHGYGIKKSKNFVSSWPSRAKDWMNSMGWLK